MPESRSLSELTRQIAPPTKNGHAPPPTESRKSYQSVNPFRVRAGPPGASPKRQFWRFEDGAGLQVCQYKSSCITNEALAPYFIQELVKELKNSPYTLVTEGSNDTGVQKMNPLTVRVFMGSKVVHQF
ncbi:unnamed protein product [Pleuronectes platessa]|uniref:Uncharacterized protein n=1 Tax=Pleuronectes platessa TaxID=8262 RepID=A0A9N7UTS8_PLEPL|nr:unnamed protein product [Pleuronectes platessa]